MEKLTGLNKIPSIGGKIEFTDEDKVHTVMSSFKKSGYDFENNPESRGRTLDEVRNSNFKINQNEQVFDRFKKQDLRAKKGD